MDRQTIRAQAKQLVRTNKRVLLLASFLFLLISAVFSVLSTLITAPSSETFQRYMQLVDSQQYAQALELLQARDVRFRETAVSELLNYLQAIVQFGMIFLCFNVVRGEESSCGMLLDGFGQWWRVLLVTAIRSLIVSFGFLLLIVPGFIALYNYRMSYYLLITHPEYGVLDCLRESRLRMQGRRMELFRLDLPYLGLALFCLIPIIGWIFLIWMLPCYICAETLFFEAVSFPFDVVYKDLDDDSPEGSL